MTAPLRLTDNRVPVYYAGGEQISAFRGLEPAPGPEDWVGSLSALPPAILPAGAPADTGVSRTERGSLGDLVAADPAGWLGAELAAAYGGSSGLLVKLLDAGERLPVHCHPGRTFARTHLGSLFGKTEGWIVLAARDDARVWLGMRSATSHDELRRWIAGRDTAAMLAAMNEMPVRAGQVLYVPAGVPHSIGPGVLIAELQEPTSFSVLADHEAFGVGEDAATLGLGWDLALSCFDLSGRTDGLFPAPRPLAPGVTSLFDADTFFRAWQVTGGGTVEPSFAVVIVTAGTGELRWDDGLLPVRHGETLVIPYAAGAFSFHGDVTALVCLPPEVS